MRLIIIALTLILTSLHSFSQRGLVGKYYSLPWGGELVLEYNFKKDTVLVNYFNWRKHSILNSSSTQEMVQTNTQKQRCYYLLKPKDTFGRTIVIEFIVLNPSVSFRQLIINDLEEFSEDKPSVCAPIESDTFKRFGLIFFSESTYNRLLKLPNVKRMKKEETIAYLKALFKAESEFMSLRDYINDGVDRKSLMIYLPNKAREIIAEIGYNPMITHNELIAIPAKFKDDPEIDSLMEELDTLSMPFHRNWGTKD